VKIACLASWQGAWDLQVWKVDIMTVHNLGVEAASREGGHDGCASICNVCVCVFRLFFYFSSNCVFFPASLVRERETETLESKITKINDNHGRIRPHLHFKPL
jgi:hypothetical protein